MGTGIRRRLEEHLPALMATARKLCKNRFDADDLVNDTIVRALQREVSLRDPTSLRSWLITILTNLFLDRVRPKPVIITSEFDMNDLAGNEPTEPLPWECISHDEHRDAIALLPSELRITYSLFVLEGMSYEDIAKKLGVAKATVGTRIYRARKELRKLLASILEKRRS